MSSDFFDTSDYFIQQKNVYYNRYQIYNNRREGIGSIKLKQNFRKKVLKFIFGKAMLPFVLEIRSANGRLEASISRKGISLMSKTIIKDSLGQKIGRIKKNSNFFNYTFKILNVSDEVIAEITGDWKNWSFIVNDSSMTQIGTIDKKWVGAIKRLFKTSDKYNVHIKTNCLNENDKIAILSSAITIDMILKKCLLVRF
ncbi:phospholipid scramblase-related protein [Flavobacterium sp. LHD-80]|uniref:phospholipid scramblase-related protein n=1 Tax=Flavobacterium sp. LHD-80 TaxID=3071411 RepID=UPI0027DEE504|nr:phospholipid scramblase-related protein [Flavobacterium sp. LHD-80]MDQ6471701.1 phospholipid scramblase-related protein [Flavobacterium sp. LHD-80]